MEKYCTYSYTHTHFGGLHSLRENKNEILVFFPINVRVQFFDTVVIFYQDLLSNIFNVDWRKISQGNIVK